MHSMSCMVDRGQPKGVGFCFYHVMMGLNPSGSVAKCVCLLNHLSSLCSVLKKNLLNCFISFNVQARNTRVIQFLCILTARQCCHFLLWPLLEVCMIPHDVNLFDLHKRHIQFMENIFAKIKYILICRPFV